MSENKKVPRQKIDKVDEPSVTSTDPKERKLARRIRIQRRLEAHKKQDASEDEGIVEKTETEKQIDASAELLEKLITEGDEVISNVRVANDAREVQRREDEIAIRTNLLQKLKEEAEDATKKYEEINSKWSSILTSKDPLDIHAGIQSQSIKCAELLAQKDIVISELKQELENADIKFANDQIKQNDDINLLIERIDTQINTISRAYRRELILIDETLKNERTAVLESITKKWDALYKERQEDELQGIERRQEIMRDYENDMNRVLIEHQEQFRAQKIWLDTEFQKLQLEVENMKALCMMNIEKLDYSYAVLKRREDENIIVKNQQKKRINKLNDIINGLKKTHAELEESTRLKIEKLKEQVLKAHKNIEELKKKSEHFTFINNRQFMQIWEMNTNTANDLLNKIWTSDKIIYEQILGLDWEPPEETLLKKEDLPSYSEAMRIIQQRDAEQMEIMKLCDPRKTDTSPERNQQKRKLLNHIMKQISDQTGFLIEDKIEEILSLRMEKDKIVIRLDNVFQALSIKSDDQVHLLIDFFLPYSFCPTCEDRKKEEIIRLEENSFQRIDEEACPCDIEGVDERTKRFIDKVRVHLPDENRDEDRRYFRSCEADTESISTTEENSTDSRPLVSTTEINGIEGMTLTCNKGHLLEIQSTNVIKALREFVEKYHQAKKCKISGRHEKKILNNDVILSRKISINDMNEYWRRYREIFSQKKEKLWDGLMDGLHKYHAILKERRKLTDETDSLRRQNDELRRLLETYKVGPDSCGRSKLESRAANRTSPFD